MIVSTIQPSFLPWLGYLEQIAYADVFVYLDDVKYTKQDWRNRNRFRTPDGNIEYLTVPVASAGRDQTLIRDMTIARQPNWQRKMLNRIGEWYRGAPAFAEVFPAVERILLQEHLRLAALDVALTEYLIEAFDIGTPTLLASDIPGKSAEKNRRLIDLCHHVGADVLYDGAAAASFIDIDSFQDEGISVVFQNYQPVPYPQAGRGPFVSHLSALDALFNCGAGARDVLLASPVPDALRRHLESGA